MEDQIQNRERAAPADVEMQDKQCEAEADNSTDKGILSKTEPIAVESTTNPD